MITINDDQLTVKINEQGAQLHSVQFEGREYLWQGDPHSWNRQAPILFPFVGRLKDDQYEYQGQTYNQTQHGFARDEKFDVVHMAPSKVELQLRDNERTLQAYPFHFQLRVTYQVTDGQLKVSYQVTNPDKDQTLIYSIGAHPGFNVPLFANEKFTDMMVKVTPAHVYPQIKLVAPGPFNNLATPESIDLRKPLRLNHELFNEDAIVIETAEKPATVTVSDVENLHGVHVITNNNKFIGIWSPYPAETNLVCIEPWWGIADGIESDGQLIHKQSMDRLQPGANRVYHFAIQPF